MPRQGMALTPPPFNCFFKSLLKSPLNIKLTLNLTVQALSFKSLSSASLSIISRTDGHLNSLGSCRSPKQNSL